MRATVRLDGETAHGTDIDFETDFGLERELASLAFGGFYRFSDRSRLDLACVPWNRGHTRTID